MKKYTILSILIFVIIIIISFFFINKREILININDLADDIIKNIKFEDELNLTNKLVVEKLYNIDNYLNEVVYMSSGATAEEIAIFEFENDEDCTQAVNKAKIRIENQLENFKDYMPKEVKKLNNAILINKNEYLIVCITNDYRKAEELINKYIK